MTCSDVDRRTREGLCVMERQAVMCGVGIIAYSRD